MLTYKKEVAYKHRCTDPFAFSETWLCDVGSLWQCDVCGREWIKVQREPNVNKWRYTVEVLDKRVQKARRAKNAKI